MLVKSARTEKEARQVINLAFVTTNLGKLKTAQEHLQPLNIGVEHAPLELDEIQSDSVEEVALHKARQAFRILKRPLIIEDSGFYIDELGDFPGPFVKYTIKSLGAEGIARLADLTKTRRCHFVGTLVYVDSIGNPRTFTGTDDKGTVALEPATSTASNSWSALWDVFIPSECTVPLSSLRDEERACVYETWAKRSVFARFGTWLTEENDQLASATPMAV